MTFVEPSAQDVMLVCRNGHVITDLLRANPDLSLGHCDRCGAVTFDRCLTCGQELPGGHGLQDIVPIGERRPPQYCAGCGAAFPWTIARALPTQNTLDELQRLLRRLP